MARIEILLLDLVHVLALDFEVSHVGTRPHLRRRLQVSQRQTVITLGVARNLTDVKVGKVFFAESRQDVLSYLHEVIQYDIVQLLSETADNLVGDLAVDGDTKHHLEHQKQVLDVHE
ncbi:MAG: hypothetical protein ACPHX8_08890 [Candidatus Poseidoniaceae archaeon]